MTTSCPSAYLLSCVLRTVSWSSFTLACEPAHDKPQQHNTKGHSPVHLVSALGGTCLALHEGVARRGPADALAVLLPREMRQQAEMLECWPCAPLHVGPTCLLFFTEGVHIGSQLYQASELRNKLDSGQAVHHGSASHG